MKTISLRIDTELERKLHYLMELKKIQDRSSYLRNLLERILIQESVEYALEEFKKRRISLWKAANFAGMSLREFMDLARERSITIIDEVVIREDIKWVREQD